MNPNPTTNHHKNGNAAKVWVLTYRKSGRTRHFVTLEAARYGTRWMSLRPERLGR